MHATQRCVSSLLTPPRSVRLVLQNFFECIYSARGDNESSDADHKPHASFAAAMEAADARTMEKFAHVAEKFVQKSVVAAIAPFKEAVMRFALLQADTVRAGGRREGGCGVSFYLVLCFSCDHSCRFASELPKVQLTTPPSTAFCCSHPLSSARNLEMELSLGSSSSSSPKKHLPRAANS